MAPGERLAAIVEKAQAKKATMSRKTPWRIILPIGT